MMNKEMMKEIMKNETQVAEPMYDEVITDMEKNFNELKKLGTTIPIVGKIEDKSFEEVISMIIEKYKDCSISERRLIVIYFITDTQHHYSYVEALFASGNTHSQNNKIKVEDELLHKDFVSRQEFINRTGVYVTPLYFEVSIRDLLTVAFLRMNLLIITKKSIPAALKKFLSLECLNMK